MITEHDLQEAIAECQGVRNPNAGTCLKLAAYYTIQDRMFPRGVVENATSQPVGNPDTFYSYAGGPAENTIDYDSGTEFGQAINGKDLNKVLAIIDEALSVLEITQPRLYSGVMNKIHLDT